MDITRNKSIEPIVYVLVICLLLSLSIWQIHRGLVKRNLLYNTEDSIYQLDTSLTIDQLINKKVSFNACLQLDSTWLLENQFLDQKLGYDLLIAAKIMSTQPLSSEHQRILINMGWLSRDLESHGLLSKDKLDSNFIVNKILAKGGISIKNFTNTNPHKKQCNTVLITGNIRPPYDLPFVTNVFSPTPSVLEITPKSFPVKYLIREYYLEIDQNHALALKTHWERSMLNSKRHFGYALQWFLMAIAVCVYLYLCLKNRTKQKAL